MKHTHEDQDRVQVDFPLNEILALNENQDPILVDFPPNEILALKRSSQVPRIIFKNHPITVIVVAAAYYGCSGGVSVCMHIGMSVCMHGSRLIA